MLNKLIINSIIFILIMQESNPITRKRIENEKKEILQNPPFNWKIICNNEKWNFWDVWITTQINTPYHTVPFKLIVTFPENYPQSPPKFELADYKIFYHPNISQTTGVICEQTIKSTQVHVKVRDRINAFVNLLATPNPNSAYNLPAGELYNQDYKKFYKKAYRIFRGIEK